MEKKRGHPIRLAFILIAVVFTCFLIINATVPRSRICNLSALTDVRMLKQIHLGASTYFVVHERVPESWALLVRYGSIVPEVCYSDCNPRSGNSGERFRLGRFSSMDMYGTSITDEELVKEARRVVPDEPWERVEDVVLSREPEAFIGFQNDLIVGFTLVGGERRRVRGGFTAAFVTGDNHARFIPIRAQGEEKREYVELIEADRAVRASLGLSEPPNYAALIFEYTAEQERLAAEGV